MVVQVYYYNCYKQHIVPLEERSSNLPAPAFPLGTSPGPSTIFRALWKTYMFVVTKKLFKEKEARDYLWPGCCFAENPFCGNRKLGGGQWGLPQPALGRREAEAARPGHSLRMFLFRTASLIAKHRHKTTGGTCVFMVLSPKKHPKWQSWNSHLDPHTHMLQQAP